MRKLTAVMGERAAGRVLVVDDEALIRWSLAEILADQGLVVDQAGSGADALAATVAAGGAFDVVILDFHLPDSTDLRLLARLRQLMPHSAVILMTAFSTPDMAQEALALGAVRVVGKPFEMREIIALVQQVR
jgi:DNA-binding NtrC family response regulator